MSRRSFRKPGLRKVRPSRRSSSVSTTHRQARATRGSPSYRPTAIEPNRGGKERLENLAAVGWASVRE
jgi:hypothetical protein